LNLSESETSEFPECHQPLCETVLPLSILFILVAQIGKPTAAVNNIGKIKVSKRKNRRKDS
jgi:hypothetical protein